MLHVRKSFLKSIFLFSAFVAVFFVMALVLQASVSAQTPPPPPSANLPPILDIGITDAEILSQFYECEALTPSGSFIGVLPPIGSAVTDNLFADKEFTIECCNRFFLGDRSFCSTASVQVFVAIPKPVVELYISPVGKSCMTRKQKTAVILNGQPATLCWIVGEGELTTDYEPFE